MLKLSTTPTIILIAFVFTGAVAYAETDKRLAPGERVYVHATQSKNIIAYDAFTYELIDDIDVGEYTDDVEGSPDGKLLFGNAQYHSGNPLAWNVNHAGKVFALDTRDHSTVWSTELDGSPHHLVASPDGKALYVPLFDKHFVLALDTATGAIKHRWHAFFGGHSLEISDDGKKLYVGNMVGDMVMVLDTDSGAILQLIYTDDGVRPLQIDEPNSRVILQLSRLHGFESFDIKTGEPIERVLLPVLKPESKVPDLYPHTVNHGLIITPDRRYLLAAASIEGYVAVYKLDDFSFVKRIDVGEDPNWIEVRSDSKVAFVSNRGGNTLSVIDLESLEEIKRLPAGDMPQRLDIVNVRPYK